MEDINAGFHLHDTGVLPTEFPGFHEGDCICKHGDGIYDILTLVH